MPRYYFDLVDDVKVHDTQGVSLPNLDAARAYAKTFARELMETKKTLLGEPHGAWTVQVCDGRLQRVLKIPFASLMDEARTPRPAAVAMEKDKPSTIAPPAKDPIDPTP